MKGKNSKLKKTVGVLLILLIFVSSISGCSFLDKLTSKEPQKTGVEGGFDLTSGDESPSMICAFRSNKTEFDINDVTLTFYFGGPWSISGIDFSRENDCSYPEFDLYFVDGNGIKHFIRHEDENFVSEKFDYQIIRNEDRTTEEIIFNHSEEITIPKELFTKESGSVIFALYGINVNSREPKVEFVAGISVYYKLESDKVIVSGNPF